MSTETLEKPIVKEAEPLLSKRRKKFLSDPLNDDNPVTVQVLGICSALAVTVQIKPTAIMAIAVIAVTVLANVVISLMRDIIPNRIRIIVQLAVVATLVILVDQLLKAYLYDVSKMVGVYVGLIITNCIIMGRLEAFAMGNKPYDSLLDGLGNGIGYAWIILAVAFFRELFGSGFLFKGSVLEVDVMGSLTRVVGLGDYNPNVLMVSPIGAFMILGIIIWVQRSFTGYTEEN